MTRNFREMLERKWDEGKFVCVGLDPSIDRFPKKSLEGCRSADDRTYCQLVGFNREVVDATKDIALAYKPNSAFYEQYGMSGIEALRHTCASIRGKTDVPIILDAKRGDIGDTNAAYVRYAFDFLGADAITLHPYTGSKALQPFLDQEHKGCLILCRTSNPGAGEFQDVADDRGWGVEKHYQRVAYNVSHDWNSNGNCGLVVGATYPEELAIVRRLAGDMPLLIPGIGKQGGNVEETVKNGRDSRGRGMIINSSSGIIYAFAKPEYEGVPFAEAARRETQKLHDEITRCLKA